VKIPKVLGDEKQVKHTGARKKLSCSPDTKILVVDDNSLNLTVISGLLHLSGITAFTATSGQETIELIRKNQYDLIFMDHMMPEMDGVETLRVIRDLKVKTPVIALTANAVTSAKEMLLASGMNDFLSKPIVKEELHDILAKWIPGSKFVDSGSEEGGSKNPATAEETEFWRKIKEINGLSMEIGLDRVAGQTGDYENLLKSLIKEIDKCTRNLNDFMADNNMKNFMIEAHSMKSSLANAGAMELSAKAHDLETASARNDSDHCESNLKYFLDELNDLSKKLTESFSMFSHHDDEIELPPELALILHILKKYIIEMKFDGINDKFRELENFKFTGALKDRIEDLKDSLIVMDYDSASETIDKLLH